MIGGGGRGGRTHLLLSLLIGISSLTTHLFRDGGGEGGRERGVLFCCLP